MEAVKSPPVQIVLYQPEIPHNTGNIGRLCAVTGARLHLIHPLGFKVTDSNLRRSGMDYWKHLDVHQHVNWEAFWESPVRPPRLWLFSTKGTKLHWDVSFEPGDGLLFGRESAGCPPEVHAQVGDAFTVTIPQYNPELRSHNLANCAAVGLYEVMRQIRGRG